MKQLMTMLICAVLSIGTAVAQNNKTYTGFVVDKNGNPLVGAEVMAPGGGASVITDSDGSFTIEVPFLLKKLTASYTGMKEKSLKLGNSSDLIFNMKSLKKMTGFISVVGNLGVAFGSYDAEGSFGAGIMGGQIGELSKWGWYVKGMGIFTTDFSGSSEPGAGSLTVGAISKIGSKGHIYFGGGVAGTGGESFDDGIGFSVDLGMIRNVGDHLNYIIGLNYINGLQNMEDILINFNIGVGYTF